MFFRGDSLSVLLMHSCIRLNSIFLFFLAFGSRSQVRHLIALLFLVPPAAKEGKGDCEYPLRTVRFAPGVPVCNKLPTSSRAQARDLRRSPYALLGFSYYPFVTPGTACQGAVTELGCVRLCPPLLVGSFTVLG